MATVQNVKGRRSITPSEALRRFENPEVKKEFLSACERRDKKLAPHIKAIRRSERITGEDLGIIVH